MKPLDWNLMNHVTESFLPDGLEWKVPLLMGVLGIMYACVYGLFYAVDMGIKILDTKHKKKYMSDYHREKRAERGTKFRLRVYQEPTEEAA